MKPEVAASPAPLTRAIHASLNNRSAQSGIRSQSFFGPLQPRRAALTESRKWDSARKAWFVGSQASRQIEKRGLEETLNSENLRPLEILLRAIPPWLDG
jgi:hypothetical protein